MSKTYITTLIVIGVYLLIINPITTFKKDKSNNKDDNNVKYDVPIGPKQEGQIYDEPIGPNPSVITASPQSYIGHTL